MDDLTSTHTVIGRFGATHGVQGWLRIQSFTEPAENIIQYREHWLIHTKGQTHAIQLLDHRWQHHKLIGQIEGYDIKEQAAALTNQLIWMATEYLPALPADQHYWHELKGMSVINTNGINLGTIDHIMNTGANDIIVVRGDRERLLPYLPHVVTQIDREQNMMTVDWDETF